VLLAQANLLWLVVVHRHDEETVPMAATAVNGAARQSLETGLLCTACQIVRHGAARPTLGTPVPSPVASTPIGFPDDAGVLAFHRLSVTYGRAPPLGWCLRSFPLVTDIPLARYTCERLR